MKLAGEEHSFCVDTGVMICADPTHTGCLKQVLKPQGCGFLWAEYGGIASNTVEVW